MDFARAAGGEIRPVAFSNSSSLVLYKIFVTALISWSGPCN